ncbi:PQQ-binding-like beta-propeller repeat protein [Actinoplanes rectilineatus]|uniref:outer membrane protein assembly factor BamB family protein n=1 Tax=Actinoplanes rectilineatus TaxID=113571 RepID=UPI0005F2A3FF|nr:PQQ-binding-like beta-propeller repeat protein [Actinoplanes rectilineatus]
MTVIELGEIGEAGERRSGSGPRASRRLLTAGVVLLCALGLGASAGSAEPATVREVWSAPMQPDDWVVARDDGLFAYTTVDGRARLTAYETATGTVRWARDYPEPLTWLSGERSGLLLAPEDEQVHTVRYDDGSVGSLMFAAATRALDPRTGADLWRQKGDVQPSGTGGLLLADRDETGGLEKLRRIDPRSGSILWERDLGGSQVLAAGSEHIVTGDRRGRLRLLRYADGSVLSERTVPWQASLPGDSRDTVLLLHGGLLVVGQMRSADGVLTGYRPDTLEKVWETPSGPVGFLAGCGPVICVDAGDALLGLDGATGRSRWVRERLHLAFTIGPDRVLASTASAPRTEQVLLDTATGRRIGGPAPGYPLGLELEKADRLVLFHKVVGATAPLSVISVLDTITGRYVRAGILESVEQGVCNAAGRHLVCDRDDRLVVLAVGD